MSPSERLRKHVTERPSARGRDQRLPRALLELVPRRLARLALTYSIAYVLAVSTGELVHHVLQDEPWALHPTHVVALVFVAFGLGVRWVARSDRLEPERLVDVGLVFMVVASLGIALGSHDPVVYWEYVDAGRDPLILGISWIAVWVAIFPVVMPSPPHRTLAAALVSANMSLVSIGIWVLLRDVPYPPAAVLAQLTLPNYICVLLAFMASRVLYQMGHDLGEARELGSYRLRERLGVGGMGEVWLASHRMLARPAAIKLIRPDEDAGLDRTAMKRFEMEAQATAALASPHTIQLYDFGIADDGSFYYVMELLDGMDLQRLVDRFGPVTAERTVHLLKGACESLREAHTRGLVHRDIKPANIYTCRLGLETDFVKVLDFGLVKPQKKDPDLTRLTMAGLALGTPGFLPPEMATGDEVDGRTDLYALGCVAFWLLTGRLVFEGETPLQTMMKHVQEEPAAPSTLSELDVPDELDTLILQCLAKKPQDRPASAEALARDLGRVPLPGEWSPETSASWWARHLPSAREIEVAPT